MARLHRCPPLSCQAHMAFQCRKRGCTRSYATERGRFLHETRHVSKRYPCKLCPNRAFGFLYELKAHHKTAHDNKLHLCTAPDCHKFFRTARALKEHAARTRHDENAKPFFTCCFEGCSFVAYRPFKLAEHVLRRHSTHGLNPLPI